ncbi:MAG: hypothetical protein KJN62_03805 [Deltaproteobacteria bacterium]|nr:hypothetical protein [Deltaproteobacteria bacterium]
MAKENSNNKLDLNIRFIEETQKGTFADIQISDAVVSNRSDEPSIYANESDETAFLSFCN